MADLYRPAAAQGPDHPLVLGAGEGVPPVVVDPYPQSLAGQFDLGDIVGKFTGSRGDLASMANSWLGDGANRRAFGTDRNGSDAKFR